MPQLNPNPWMWILLLTWLTYLIVLPFKVVARKFSRNPTPEGAEKPPSAPWFWRWH
uniref:ATP synthase complex subunit 8 n=1 Tax=Gigantura chuni TaxID=172116 RepID=A0A0E4FKN3_9TELE|nr:adenosine triphosphatase subunit 8 [Gigantura chuni]